MSVTEDEIVRDEQERSNLLRAIADVETAMAVSTPGTRHVLENTLENAKKRVVVLDKKIERSKEEHAAEVQAHAVAVAAAVAKETALNVREREEYGGFLREEFFTKKDFGKLAEFYSRTWDRLSEGGKDEMSHRVWEGVRRGEYRFDDLPKDVREKEEKRIYAKLIDPSRKRDDLDQIPEADRNDFIQAYKAGDGKKAGEVLSRESFHRNVATEASNGVKHHTATAGREADDHSVLADGGPKDTASNGFSAMAKLKSASEKLKDLTLDDSPPAPLAAAIPDAGVSQVNGRPPI